LYVTNPSLRQIIKRENISYIGRFISNQNYSSKQTFTQKNTDTVSRAETKDHNTRKFFNLKCILEA